MTQLKNRWYIIFLICFILVGIFSSRVNAEEKINALFISSYSPNFITFEEQIKGIKSSLGENINFNVEYMDFIELDGGQREKDFYNLLKYTLTSYGSFDVILVGDDEALEFAIKYKNDLFKDVPIVFFSVEDEELIQKALDYEMISGVREVESVISTIELIRSLHKDVKNIVFLNDYDNGPILNEYYNEAVLKYKNINFSKIATGKLSKLEFKNMLLNLDSNTAIINFYPTHFRENYWLTQMDITELISQNTNNVPVYEILSLGIGHGSIGGKVISHYHQGKHAGEIAKKIINGEDSRNLYIGDDGANKYIFDYNVLKEFGIKKNNLPKDSIIINSPKDLVFEYKGIVISVMILLIGLVCIIIGLTAYIVYKSKYEKSILKAAKAAEEMNRLKAHFISNISHELKTPITVIMSVIQLQSQKDKLLKSYDEDSNENYNIINNNCNRLIRLLDNIIDVEKHERGELKLETEKINIIELLEDIVMSVEPYTRAKNLNLVFDTTVEEVFMDVDCKKIERILLNLLSNAIKFSKENGHILVNIDTDRTNLIITVEDDGIGMKEKHLNQIFDRFVQIDNTLTRKNEGSGIGLSIVKAFVELHSGKIDIKSKINKGTTFRVELPITNIEKTNEQKALSKAEDIITKIELSDIYF